MPYLLIEEAWTTNPPHRSLPPPPLFSQRPISLQGGERKDLRQPMGSPAAARPPQPREGSRDTWPHHTLPPALQQSWSPCHYPVRSDSPHLGALSGHPPPMGLHQGSGLPPPSPIHAPQYPQHHPPSRDTECTPKDICEMN